MIRCAMMVAKLTKWETSGRRSTWVPSAPARALEDSRYDMISLPGSGTVVQ